MKIATFLACAAIAGAFSMFVASHSSQGRGCYSKPEHIPGETKSYHYNCGNGTTIIFDAEGNKISGEVKGTSCLHARVVRPAGAYCVSSFNPRDNCRTKDHAHEHWVYFVGCVKVRCPLLEALFKACYECNGRIIDNKSYPTVPQAKRIACPTLELEIEGEFLEIEEESEVLRPLTLTSNTRPKIDVQRLM